ncbi:MAG: glycosyltransferase family 4 protein [Kiritimatiellae bacterium]|nr:glycosyltransferase family 4 protein [Kiritimatiellia bacterium]
MKILQVLPALGQGGVERGTLEIAAALSAAGIENAVVSSGGAMTEALLKTGARHYTMDAATKNPFKIVANAFRIASLVKREGFSLIHVRSRAPAWSVMLASRMSGVPYIATYHGLYGTSPRFLKIPYNRVMLKGVRTIAVSDCVKRHIIENYGIDPDRIVRIHRGADTTVFNGSAPHADELRKTLGFPDGMKVITLPGRLTYLKGQKDLIAAAGMMKTRPIGLLFVGSDQGRTDYSKSLREMAARLPPEIKTVFLERSDDMPSVYGMSDVVVSATGAKPESFGRVIPEAQAMGRIVVGTAHGGSCETIDDGKTGFLVPPRDPASLAAKLDEVLAMPAEKVREMRRAAAKSVRERFSTAKMCEETIALYRRITAQNMV